MGADTKVPTTSSIQHAHFENGVHVGQRLLDLHAGLHIGVHDDIADAALGVQELLADVGLGLREHIVDRRHHTWRVLVDDQQAVGCHRGVLLHVDLREVHCTIGAALVDALEQCRCDLLADHGLGLLCGATDMRRHQRVRAAAQLGLEEVLAVLARLSGEDVYVGTAEVFRLQRRCQVRNHHHVAAAGIQEEGALLHLGELLLADHVLRGGQIRHMQRHEVRLRQELIQGGNLRGVAHGQLWDDVPVDDFHAHRLGQDGDLSTDVPIAHDAQRLSSDLEAANRLLEPSATVHRSSAVSDLPRQTHDVADDELCHAARVREGRVEHGDAIVLCSLQVDLIGADTEAGHRQELVAGFDDLLRDLRLAADAQDVQALDLHQQLLLRQRRLQSLHLETCVLQHLDAPGRDTLEQEDLDLVLGEGQLLRGLTLPLQLSRHGCRLTVLSAGVRSRQDSNRQA
mmetsp:Transcript_60942/g.172308  ORF Transcript_60942/g.172308 Transcript_60942/m.172308 type:complete len:456 (-) Transcript_60942:8-1375(-)